MIHHGSVTLFISAFLIFGMMAVGVCGSLLPRDGMTVHYQHIAKRNLSTFLNDIPPACKSNCDVVVGAAHNCQYLACVCTTDNANQLVQCVNCVVALTPYEDGIVDKYQLILDEWKNNYCSQFACPDMKVKVPLSSTSTATATSSSKPIKSDSMRSRSPPFKIWVSLVFAISIPLSQV